MNSTYKYLNEYGLVIAFGIFLVSLFVFSFFIPDPPQPYTTTSDVEARRFIARCDSGVLIQERDGIFTMECGEL